MWNGITAYIDEYSKEKFDISKALSEELELKT